MPADQPPADPHIMVEAPQIAAEFAGEAGVHRPGLTLLPPRRRCPPPRADGAIVVCADRPDDQRLSPLDPTFDRGPGRAEWRLGGGAVADLHVEQTMIGGAPSNRVMVGLKIKM